MKKLIVFFLTLFPLSVFAGDTPCATGIFENALSQTANSVSEFDTEEVIEQWIQSTLSKTDNIKQVLKFQNIGVLP